MNVKCISLARKAWPFEAEIASLWNTLNLTIRAILYEIWDVM